MDILQTNIRSEAYRTIFIGHANPEDNYFSAWLASKLRLMNYDVWCDIDQFRGGEDFWLEIAAKIREQSAKCIFVTSATSIKKDGTLKELAIADRIKDRRDFIIPVRIDQVSFDDSLPETIRKFTVDFSNNWAEGLLQISEKLQRDCVPKSTAIAEAPILPFWYKACRFSS